MAEAPRVAATVILLREVDDEVAVFLVQRHRRSRFMPNMWVFPGGRVDPRDHEVDPSRMTGRVARLGAAGTGAAVAAIRETYEEAGIWLGTGTPDPSVRGPMQRGEVSLADCLTAWDAQLPLDRLWPWARWVTPKQEGRRYDTWFFLALVDEAGGSHDAHETVASGWFRPAEVLEAGLTAYGLAPPTWWTLSELARLRTAAAVRDAIGGRDLTPVEPIVDADAEGFGIALPGHGLHGDPQRSDLPTRIGLTAGAWVATDAP